MFQNSYADTLRAAAYDELEFAGTYRLAFRDLPTLLCAHVRGNQAIDFGCGTGRSTRLLQDLGYRTVGVDVSQQMVDVARQRDPSGDYRVIDDGDFSSLPQGSFDLALSAFTFDNIPGPEWKTQLFAGLRRLLKPNGHLVNIVSTPEIYLHEWVTFTTRDFPENAKARCGEVVRIITKDYSDRRPVEDILWPDENYRMTFREAGFALERKETPLARGDESVSWVNETVVAPWAIYVLRPLDIVSPA